MNNPEPIGNLWSTTSTQGLLLILLSKETHCSVKLVRQRWKKNWSSNILSTTGGKLLWMSGTKACTPIQQMLGQWGKYVEK